MSQDTLIRPLDRGERFFWLVDFISSMNCLAIVQLADHPLTEEVLRRGLDTMQAAHPLLSARVVEAPDGTVAFHRHEGARIPLKIEMRGEGDWQVPVEAEMTAHFDDPELPLARAQLIVLPDRSVLNLTFHHAIIDGKSMMMLTNELLRFCLRSTPIPLEHDVAPPMHTLFPSAFQWGENPDKARDLAQSMAEEALILGPPTELPFLAHETPRKEPKLRRMQFDLEQSERLRERCRAEGTSIQGIICAAELIATYELFEEAEARTMYLISPADLRPYIDADLTGRLSFCSTLLRSTHRVEGRSAFWQLSREVTADVRRRVQRGDGHLLYSALPVEKIGSSGPAFSAFTDAFERLPAGVNATNQGRFDPLYDCPEVEAISFAMLAMPKHLSSLNVCSFRDEVSVNMTYDAAKLARELADRVWDTVRELLEDAAG